MQQKNKTGKIAAIAGLAAVLVIGFVVVPKLIANPPDESGIETIVAGEDVLAEAEAEGEGVADSDTEALIGTNEDGTAHITYGLTDNENLSNYMREEMMRVYPDMDVITRDQAIAGAIEGLALYGYEFDTVGLEFMVMFYGSQTPTIDPTCQVAFRYDYELPGEFEMQDYLSSEQFKGLSEEEIREIIEADDLSHIPNKPKKLHPKYKILEGESYTACFWAYVDLQTGEFIKATESRVRYGHQVEFAEAYFKGTPIGDPGLYYPSMYY
jgi:hypothetical protein